MSYFCRAKAMPPPPFFGVSCWEIHCKLHKATQDANLCTWRTTNQNVGRPYLFNMAKNALDFSFRNSNSRKKINIKITNQMDWNLNVRPKAYSDWRFTFLFFFFLFLAINKNIVSCFMIQSRRGDHFFFQTKTKCFGIMIITPAEYAKRGINTTIFFFCRSYLVHRISLCELKEIIILTVE